MTSEPGDTRDPSRRRPLEVAVAGISWGLIALPLWGPWLAPDLTAVFVVAFAAYMLCRSVKIAVLGVVGVRQLQAGLARDWLREARRMPGWERIHHLVVLPTYLEPVEVLVDSLEHLERQDFPADRIAVVVAFEERDPTAPANAQHVLQRFGRSFGTLLVTSHPLRPGEVPGKSANLAWAVRQAKEQIVDAAGLDLEDVIVTVCDADSRLHAKYLSAVTHAVLADRDPSVSIYQPAMLLHGNASRTPSLFHMVDALYSLTSLVNLVATYRLRPFSTYSLLLATCDRVGYWDPDVIPEDSHMFFKVLFRHTKPVRVRPILLPVLADAADGNGLRGSALSHYKQARRWAWGVSDIPYVLSGLGPPTRGVWWSRLVPVTLYVQDHLIWSASWPILAIGLHPWTWVAPAFWVSPLAARLIAVYSTVVAAGLPLLVVVAVLNFCLLAAVGYTPLRGLLAIVASWVLFPLLSFALMWAPAADAHLRLLLGRPLSYQVTLKLARAPVEPRLVAAGRGEGPRG